MTTTGPKYPELEVELIGTDSNAIAIVAAVGRAMRQYRDDDRHRLIDDAEIDAFRKEALSGDYNNVLQTCMRWVSVS